MFLGSRSTCWSKHSSHPEKVVGDHAKINFRFTVTTMLNQQCLLMYFREPTWLLLENQIFMLMSRDLVLALSVSIRFPLEIADRRPADVLTDFIEFQLIFEGNHSKNENCYRLSSFGC